MKYDMTIWSAFYKLLIGPLELLFEFIFAVIYRHISQPGIVIIAMSLIVNLLVLPLYRRADAMQAEERETEERLRRWKDHINKTFHGDERFMILQTYYRQNNYRPADALKGSFSLLLEIPFFLAAYNFLSGLRVLNNVSFGPIRNLGAPDALLTIGGISINVLPFLMTLINILSGAIYMKGFPLKTKLRTYGMALIFLVLLYRSPSGLVFYWTLNNVFSLLKNIVSRMKDTGRFMRIGAAFLTGCGILALNYLLFSGREISSRNALIFSAALLILLLLLLYFLGVWKIKIKVTPADNKDDSLFIISCLFLTVLIGCLIPSSVIKTAPGDFVDIQAYYSPLLYILSSFLLAAGTFLIWINVFYRLSNPSLKKIFSFFMACFAVCSVINYMFFGKERGQMSGQLVFDNYPQDTVQSLIVNTALLIEIFLLIFLLWKKKENLLNMAMLTLGLAVTVMSVLNTCDIMKDLKGIEKNLPENLGNIPKITLSKEGKNVIILMMDRSVGYYVPFLMSERPELRRQFDGFIFYPNTLSFASTTNEGLPAIYGGYEYTPEHINQRAEEPLVQKHNEALLMMPRIFSDKGYKITVCDPSYAGYKEISDLHIYDGINNLSAYYLDGLFTSDEVKEASVRTLSRNFFCYSLYKTAPLVFQPVLYTGGAYNNVDVLAGEVSEVRTWQMVYDLLNAKGIPEKFNRAYSVIENLSLITDIDVSDVNTFTALDNLTTHEQTILQMPDYVPADKVYNAAYETIPIIRKSVDGREIELDSFLKLSHYHINMAAFLQLGRWMDFLKDNGVYDNTRIIITADHGQGQDFPEHQFDEGRHHDILSFNPTLMVKDFNSKGFSVDDSFMTNADVPTIAFKDLIPDPVNPATGNPVSDAEKNESTHKTTGVTEWNIKQNDENVFLPAYHYQLHGNNIFDTDSWEVLGEY